MTPLDHAHAEMESDPENAQARLKFYDRLAGSELFLLLEDEPREDKVRPRVFPVEGGQFVLVFDREERLTEFVGGSAPYVALSGRTLAEMLNGQGLGLGVNLGIAPSSILIAEEALGWLAETLSDAPEELEAKPREISAPSGLPEILLTALDSRLASAEGLAAEAYLAAVTYQDGRRGHLLGFVGPVPGAEPALAQTVADALTFSGIEAGSLDVVFFRADDPVIARFAAVGLRFDLPEAPGLPSPPKAPGMDPEAPPRLR